MNASFCKEVEGWEEGNEREMSWETNKKQPISWAAVVYVLPLSSPWRCRCSQSRTTHWRLPSDSPASPSQTAHRCNSHTKHTLCLHITAIMSHNWCTRYMLELSFRSLFIFLTLSLTWAAWRDSKLKATGDRCHCSYQVIRIKHSLSSPVQVSYRQCSNFNQH